MGPPHKKKGTLRGGERESLWRDPKEKAKILKERKGGGEKVCCLGGGGKNNPQQGIITIL